MAGESFLCAVALVGFFRHNRNELLPGENIFTDTEAFCKSVVCLFLFSWIIAYFPHP